MMDSKLLSIFLPRKKLLQSFLMATVTREVDQVHFCICILLLIGLGCSKALAQTPSQFTFVDCN